MRRRETLARSFVRLDVLKTPFRSLKPPGPTPIEFAEPVGLFLFRALHAGTLGHAHTGISRDTEAARTRFEDERSTCPSGRTLIAVVSNWGEVGTRQGLGGHDNAPPRFLLSICRNESRDTGLKVSAGRISLNYITFLTLSLSSSCFVSRCVILTPLGKGSIDGSVAAGIVQVPQIR